MDHGSSIMQNMTSQLNKIRIIIIDDHQLIGQAWKSMLETNPQLEVIGVYGNPVEGVERVKENFPDILIVDINMKQLTGMEVTKLTKKFSPLTKIIAISLLTQPVIVKKIIKYGAKGYLTKSSDKKELFEAIESVLKGENFICKEIKDILIQMNFTDAMEDQRRDFNLLSLREMQVLNLLKDGNSSKEIAQKLFLSIRTVDVHRHNILKKMKLKNVTALINVATEEGLFYN